MRWKYLNVLIITLDFYTNFSFGNNRLFISTILDNHESQESIYNLQFFSRAAKYFYGVEDLHVCIYEDQILSHIGQDFQVGTGLPVLRPIFLGRMYMDKPAPWKRVYCICSVARALSENYSSSDILFLTTDMIATPNLNANKLTEQLTRNNQRNIVLFLHGVELGVECDTRFIAMSVNLAVVLENIMYNAIITGSISAIDEIFPAFLTNYVNRMVRFSFETDQ